MPAARLVLAAFMLSFLAGCATTPRDESARVEARAEVREMAQRTLVRLHELQPQSRDVIARAAGYAVFSNFGLKILVAGGGSGQGIVVERGVREVFMRMVELQAGLGFGVKQFSLVFVFDSPAALRRFVDSGWEFGGQGTIAASDGVQGGAVQSAVSVAPGVWVYQLTEKGLAAELTVRGTKYYRDSKLD